MRKKIKYQKEFEFNPPTFIKKIKIYRIFDHILRENPQIANLAYADLTRKVKNPVKQLEQLSYRELPMKISDSVTLRRFCEFNNGEVPCYCSIATDAGFYSKANAKYAKKMVNKGVMLDIIAFVRNSWVYKIPNQSVTLGGEGDIIGAMSGQASSPLTLQSSHFI